MLNRENSIFEIVSVDLGGEYSDYLKRGGCLDEDTYKEITEILITRNWPSYPENIYKQQSLRCSFLQARQMATTAEINLTSEEEQMYAFLRIRVGSLSDQVILAQVLTITDSQRNRLNRFISQYPVIFPKNISQNEN